MLPVLLTLVLSDPASYPHAWRSTPRTTPQNVTLKIGERAAEVMFPLRVGGGVLRPKAWKDRDDTLSWGFIWKRRF